MTVEIISDNQIDANLTGDELNQNLALLLLPNNEIELKERAYKAYLKQLSYQARYREKHRE